MPVKICFHNVFAIYFSNHVLNQRKYKQHRYDLTSITVTIRHTHTHKNDIMKIWHRSWPTVTHYSKAINVCFFFNLETDKWVKDLLAFKRLCYTTRKWNERNTALYSILYKNCVRMLSSWLLEMSHIFIASSFCLSTITSQSM